MAQAITLKDIVALDSEEDRIELLMQGLNEKQRECAMTLTGAVAAIAGPGAGKTKTLIVRTAHLLVKEVPATSIMLVTFTNKGSDEIKERLELMVGDVAQYITAGTFHSIIYKVILKANASHPYLASIGIDFNECTIFDDSESTALFEEAIKQLDKDSQDMIDEKRWAKKIEEQMAAARAKGHTAETYAREMIGFGDPGEVLFRLTKDVWDHYSTLCRAANGIDFDDILVIANQLMIRDPELGRELAERYRYLMLDEYQDTNPVQMKIMDQIAKHHENILVVGDEKQSIYGFRGADIKVILGFKQRYPSSKKIEMNINYRSTPAILKASNVLAGCMKQKISEGSVIKDHDQYPEGAPVSIVAFESDLQEADVIARAIKRDLANGIPGKEIAILYHSRQAKPVIEQALVQNAINYQVVGDIGFYQRAEVKNAIAMLRFTFRPWDSMAACRVLKCTSFGVSDKSAKKAMAEGKTAHAYLVEMAAKTNAKKEPSAVALKLAPLLDAMLSIRKLVAYGEHVDYVRSGVERLWETYLGPGVRRAAAQKDNMDLDDAIANSLQNVAFLLDRFFKELEEGRKPEDILEELSMLGDMSRQTEADQLQTIRIMTIHASKGMEMGHVYLPALDRDTTPGEKEEDLDVLEEKRRVLYVGMTRAKWKLGMSFAKTKRKFGQRISTEISPYLKEVAMGLGKQPFNYKAPEGSTPHR